jgi:hypothetical protein
MPLERLYVAKIMANEPAGVPSTRQIISRFKQSLNYDEGGKLISQQLSQPITDIGTLQYPNEADQPISLTYSYQYDSADRLTSVKLNSTETDGYNIEIGSYSYDANNPSMIGLILKLAAFTYGPLLGLFAFGMFTRRQVNDAIVPWVVLAAPILCFIIDANQSAIFGVYQIGLELLLINGAITFAGLWVISKAAQTKA